MRVGNRDLNSQSPSPRLRTSGIPRGQRNWRVLRSSPIMRRSSVGSSLSHSRTGSRPVADRKNKTENGGEPATTKTYHRRYVLQEVLAGAIFGLHPPCRAYPQNPLAKNHDDFVPALGLRHFCRINSPKHPWAYWRIDWRAGLISYLRFVFFVLHGGGNSRSRVKGSPVRIPLTTICRSCGAGLGQMNARKPEG